ncbi:MAG: hypothetical protein BA870_05740 [Desulfuromonadales bacterium C00003094]|nr:MAG: hypothetical protein BA870_05740 [Desulfuromonadales bacterium C00003094]
MAGRLQLNIEAGSGIGFDRLPTSIEQRNDHFPQPFEKALNQARISGKTDLDRVFQNQWQ